MHLRPVCAGFLRSALFSYDCTDGRQYKRALKKLWKRLKMLYRPHQLRTPGCLLWLASWLSSVTCSQCAGVKLISTQVTRPGPVVKRNHYLLSLRSVWIVGANKRCPCWQMNGGLYVLFMGSCLTFSRIEMALEPPCLYNITLTLGINYSLLFVLWESLTLPLVQTDGCGPQEISRGLR